MLEGKNGKILIVGLGNPGEKYRRNRHNAGFMFVDWLGEELNIGRFTFDKKNNADVAKAQLSRHTLLAKPQVFMNESGIAVRQLASYYNIEAGQIILVHDDLDISIGEYKVQHSKGPKKHNGVESVERELGTSDFYRVRIGVENRGVESENLGYRVNGKEYVLQDFNDDEKALLAQCFPRIKDKIFTLLEDEI